MQIKPEQAAALEQYAQQHGKQPDDVLDDAVARFLEYETWFAEAVEEGLRAADRGEFIDHRDFRTRIDSRYPG